MEKTEKLRLAEAIGAACRGQLREAAYSQLLVDLTAGPFNDWEAAIRAHSTEKRPWVLCRDLSTVYEHRGHFSEAMDAAIAALGYNALQPRLWEAVARWAMLLSRWQEAALVIEMALHQFPEVEALNALWRVIEAEKLRKRGAYAAALGQLEQAERLYKGLGLIQSLHIAAKSQAMGIQPERLKASRQGARGLTAVQMGHNGRYGHSVQEYLILNILAEHLGMPILLPEWFGDYLYENEAVPRNNGESRNLSMAVLSQWKAGQRRALGEGIWNLGEDLRKRCAREPMMLAAIRRKRWELSQKLRLRAQWQSGVERAIGKILDGGKTLISVHIRRGDMAVLHPDALQAAGTYSEWLERHWQQVKKPLLYIATDGGAEELAAFAKYGPYHAGHLEDQGCPQIRMLAEFELLRRSAYLAVSRSRYSTLALLLNTRLIAAGIHRGGQIESVPAEQLERTETYTAYAETLLF